MTRKRKEKNKIDHEKKKEKKSIPLSTVVQRAVLELASLCCDWQLVWQALCNSQIQSLLLELNKPALPSRSPRFCSLVNG